MKGKAKMVFKIIGIILLVLVSSIIILAIYNQIALRLEAKKIAPCGQLVEVGGYKVHVYTESKNDNAPTLVFLSGSGTSAPVYDFKQLYRLLSDDYKIAVVEKAGYGYSDRTDTSRDVDTMVNEVRVALTGAGIAGRYVLIPHSMSGLEAIYWAQNYPDEVAGIIGLDMALPEHYDYLDVDNRLATMSFLKATIKLGLHRIPFVYPINDEFLTKDEAKQQRYLIYRNALNSVFINEGNWIKDNAQTVKNGGDISCPVLMFSSNGKQTGTGDLWIPVQEKFSEANNAELIVFDCGHYIHYYKSDEMAVKIKEFLQDIK